MRAILKVDVFVQMMPNSDSYKIEPPRSAVGSCIPRRNNLLLMVSVFLLFGIGL